MISIVHDPSYMLFSFGFRRKEKKVRLHHSTTLFTTAKSKKSLSKTHAAAIEKLPSEWLFYEEMSRYICSAQVIL